MEQITTQTQTRRGIELTVTKEHGQYTLRGVDDLGCLTDHAVEHKAQLMVDYIWLNWPVGTRVRWVVRP